MTVDTIILSYTIVILIILLSYIVVLATDGFSLFFSKKVVHISIKY